MNLGHDLDAMLPAGWRERRIVTVDPGLSACGWADYRIGLLGACGYARGEDHWRRGAVHDACRVHAVAEAVAIATEEYPCEAPWTLLVECPQVRRAGRQGHAAGADPQDLVHLALVAGAVVMAIRGLVGAGTQPTALFVRPEQWKGQVPKEIMCARIAARIANEEKSTGAERAALATGLPCASLAHNTLDAVGIGLAALGRTG
ncbi:MAG: hypothetical protein WC700_14950 [Gemmatimonadaceae bacterium]